jgi:hypothetical protein
MGRGLGPRNKPIPTLFFSLRKGLVAFKGRAPNKYCSVRLRSAAAKTAYIDFVKCSLTL